MKKLSINKKFEIDCNLISLVEKGQKIKYTKDDILNQLKIIEDVGRRNKAKKREDLGKN